jgi:hypothetical protein
LNQCPIGLVPFQARGILPVAEEKQSRTRGSQSGGVEDQLQCRGLWHSSSPSARSLSRSRSPPPPSFTLSPPPPRSLVRDGQTSPHRPRLVVSRSTCPSLSPSPHANSVIIGTAVINTHTVSIAHNEETHGRGHDYGGHYSYSAFHLRRFHLETSLGPVSGSFLRTLFFDGNIRLFCRIGSKPFFMVDSENVGKGEIKECNRTVMHFPCECISISHLVWNFLLEFRLKGRIVSILLQRTISCGISCGIHAQNTPPHTRAEIRDESSKSKGKTSNPTACADQVVPGLLTTLLSSGNTPGMAYGALAKIQNPWRQKRRLLRTV